MLFQIFSSKFYPSHSESPRLFPTPPTNHSSRYDDSAPATPGPLPRIASSTSQSEIPHPENKHYPPEKLMVGRWFYFEMVLIFRGHVNFQGVYTKEIQCGICCPSKNNISLHFFFLHMFIFNAHSSLHLYVKYSRIYVHSSRFKHSWVIDTGTQQWIPSIIHFLPILPLFPAHLLRQVNQLWRQVPEQKRICWFERVASKREPILQLRN